MPSKEYIEKFLRDAACVPTQIELHNDGWYCRLTIQKNFDARLNHCITVLKAKLISKQPPNAEIRVPVEKPKLQPKPAGIGGKVAPIPVPVEKPKLQPKPAGIGGKIVPIPSSERLIYDPSTSLSTQVQLQHLLDLYQQHFGRTGELAVLDEGHFAVTFGEDLAFPFKHPFLPLMVRMSHLAPIAVATETLASNSRTTVYFAPPSELPAFDPQGIMIHVDGAYKDGVGTYGVRYLAKGQPVTYLSGALRCKDNNSAELIAILEAIAHLASNGIPADGQEVIIHTDSEYIVQWLGEAGRDWWEQAAAKHNKLILRPVGREQNDVAHKLAHKLLSRVMG